MNENGKLYCVTVQFNFFGTLFRHVFWFSFNNTSIWSCVTTHICITCHILILGLFALLWNVKYCNIIGVQRTGRHSSYFIPKNIYITQFYCQWVILKVKETFIVNILECYVTRICANKKWPIKNVNLVGNKNDIFIFLCFIFCASIVRVPA